MRRDSAHLEESAETLRGEIIAMAAATSVIGLDAMLSLDSELAAAVERLKRAEAAKKALGFPEGA